MRAPYQGWDGLPSECLHLPLAFQRLLPFTFCQPHGQGVLQRGFPGLDHTPKWIGPRLPRKIHRSLPWAPLLKCILLWSSPASNQHLFPGPSKEFLVLEPLFPSWHSAVRFLVCLWLGFS